MEPPDFRIDAACLPTECRDLKHHFDVEAPGDLSRMRYSATVTIQGIPVAIAFSERAVAWHGVPVAMGMAVANRVGELVGTFW